MILGCAKGASRSRCRPCVKDGNGRTTIQILQPKTARARRTIKIPAALVAQLRSWRVEQTERRLRIGNAWIETGVVADRGDGGLLCPDAFTKATKRLVKSAGLDPATRLHDLRRAYATALLAGGVHPGIASAVLGHASPAFTLTQYSHVLDGMTDVAADVIDQAFRKPGATA